MREFTYRLDLDRVWDTIHTAVVSIFKFFAVKGIVIVLFVDNDNFIVQFGTLWKERYCMSGMKGRSRQTFFRQGRAVFLNHVQLTFNCTQLQLKPTTNKSNIILVIDPNGQWQVLESFARRTAHMLWLWDSIWGYKTFTWNIFKYHTSQETWAYHMTKHYYNYNKFAKKCILLSRKMRHPLQFHLSRVVSNALFTQIKSYLIILWRMSFKCQSSLCKFKDFHISSF